MKFIRTKNYILNTNNIHIIIESSDKTKLHIEFDHSDLKVTIEKLEWNKAVREAGVPSLQWID